MIAAAVVGVFVVLAVGIMQASNSQPSDSYRWGTKAGNSAVPLVEGGAGFETSCKAMLRLGAMHADTPILNPDPPPQPFNYADGMQGCLDQLHKRLGY